MPIGQTAVSVTPRASTAVWGGVGFGLGSAGLGGQLDLSRVRNDRMIRTRLSGHTNMGSSYSTSSGPEDISEWSVMVGSGKLCCGNNWGGWAVGPSWVSGSSGWSPARKIQTLGITGEAFLVSARFPHLALSAFGNANAQRPFAGLNISLLLGRMPFLTTAGPWRPRPTMGR
jgi:hypothetical protein